MVPYLLRRKKWNFIRKKLLNRENAELLDLQQLALEDEGVPGFDLSSGARAVPVTQFTWDVDSDLAPDLRLGQSARKTLDYAVHRKTGRLSTVD